MFTQFITSWLASLVTAIWFPIETFFELDIFHLCVPDSSLEATSLMLSWILPSISLSYQLQGQLLLNVFQVVNADLEHTSHLSQPWVCVDLWYIICTQDPRNISEVRSRFSKSKKQILINQHGGHSLVEISKSVTVYNIVYLDYRRIHKELLRGFDIQKAASSCTFIFAHIFYLCAVSLNATSHVLPGTG